MKQPKPRCNKHKVMDREATVSRFIGDHPENDIRPAKDCGMMAIWKRGNHFAPPDEVDAIIDSLSELHSVLEALITQSGSEGRLLVEMTSKFPCMEPQQNEKIGFSV